MDKAKNIPHERWKDHSTLFTNGNKGRLVSILKISFEGGDENMADNLKFLALDYDPAGKGDDMVISCGEEEIEFTHTIEAPEAWWESHDEKGEVTSIEIIDQNDVRTILTFQ